MINLHAAQLLSIPQGAKSDVAPKLPWPNGSIITAKITPTDSEGSVILSLGGYRMRAQVPPNTPMGSIWLQLMSRDLPMQFRLLSDTKAAILLSEMLDKKTHAVEEHAKHAGKQSSEAWPKMDMDGLPVRADAGLSEQYLMLRDKQDGGTHGMLNRQVSGDQFRLHGRVDLKHIGALAFSLHGEANTPWKVNLYVNSGEHIDDLRHGFSAWLEARHRTSSKQVLQRELDGNVLYGMPDDFKMLREVKA
ncbi:MAG: hypothetical protein Q9M11_02520 [Mariprofundaceae bacterium]|nr:hypothetical protein [Mariprofundaceae bacterium]